MPKTSKIKPKRNNRTSKRTATSGTIQVRGAAEHNLKNVDVNIPRDQLVVITGLSGSGKSSLAFDTIFAEGQRKYMESLSSYARQFLNVMQKPNVEAVDGLPPTIAIEQRSGGHNPRSIVATTTEIYDYLRLLYARCGTPRCWQKKGNGKRAKVCGKYIEKQSIVQIVDALLTNKQGARLMLLAPVIRGKKGYHRDVIESLQNQGFVRARVDGELKDLREVLKETGENPLQIGRYEQHTIEAVVDRIILKPDSRSRLDDSIETALKASGGTIVASIQLDKDAPWIDETYSEHFACPTHPQCNLEELEPRLFSFNSPFGACSNCGGLGGIQEFDLDLIIDDEQLTIAEGVIVAFKRIGYAYQAYFNKLIKRVCKKFSIDLHIPWKSLPIEDRKLLLYGAEENQTANTKRKRKLKRNRVAEFRGIIPILHDRYENTETARVKERIATLMSQTPCPTCEGKRLRKEALHVFIESASLGEVNIAQCASMTVCDALDFISDLILDTEQAQIAEPVVNEIKARLGFLQSVGIGYLNLNRKTGSLSGGEAQRIRLATQVGTGLVGVCYVLDEPTIGLHQRDNTRLIKTLRHLTDIGNTVIVVEHDEDMIRAADYILDIGPGPGLHGGEIVAHGSLDQIVTTPRSLTGKFLSGIENIERESDLRPLSPANAITIKGAKQNNLKSINVAFPLGGMICVTGVSGSGKSTLVNDILLKGIKKHLHNSRQKPGTHTRINGMQKIDRVVAVDQSPIGRTPRSNPATYTQMFGDIRNLFAKTREARIRGYQPGRFSFNVKGGRCEACQGQGTKCIEMHFLPDVYVECEVCKSARYNRETLEVRYKHKSIADILDMTVEQGVDFFDAHPKIYRVLKCLYDVGLGYIKLGQPSPTLSGGEAQRVKLATELSKGTTLHGTQSHTLYILDEPTTGLHFADIRKLLSVLNRLADQGNTLVVIEHNLDVIMCADWIIDLGPEGGEGGGEVIAVGPPEHVMKLESTSYTAQYLKKHVSTHTKRLRYKK